VPIEVHSAAVAEQVAAVPLKIHVWDQKLCPAGARAEREIVAFLAAQGKKVGKDYEVTRSDDGSCPLITYRDIDLCPNGYDGLDAFRTALSAASGGAYAPPPAKVVSRAAPAASYAAPRTVGVSSGIVLNPGERLIAIDGRPVSGSTFSGVVPMDETGRQLYAEQYRPRATIPPARQRWYQNGHSATAAHLRSHGIDPTGMSQAEMDRAHSHAHEGTWNPAWAPSGGGYSYSQPVRARSAKTYRVQNAGLFGGFFRRASGGCPSGMCPN
jgi:hypothetical protein